MPVLQDGRTYKCSFGSANVTTVVSGDEYSCTTPNFGEIPEIVDARSMLRFVVDLFWLCQFLFLVKDEFCFNILVK